MPVTDPRTRFDDLYVERNEHTVDEERFAGLAEYEAYASGWVTTAVTLDDEGRVLLAYDAEYDHWVVPGGTLKEGESLRDSVVREVKEETGVPVTPERPHGLIEVVATHGDKSQVFNVVTFEASPERTQVGTDLGVEDESITEARWFDDLPEDTFERAHAARMLERIRDH